MLKTKEIKSRAESIANPVVTQMENVLNGLYKNSQIGEAEALDMANSVNISDDAIETFSWGTDNIRSSIADFYRLTGGKMKPVKEIYKSDDRAYANQYLGINIGDQSNALAKPRTTLFHEMGHFVEFGNSQANEQSREWIKSRASGNPVQIKSLAGMEHYGNDEIAYPDDFISPYVGKIYDDGSTEVISTGLEHFTSPKKMAQLLEKDPEHFYFIMGVIGG